LRVLIPIVLSYLLGSIPFGYLIVSAKTGGDIRQTGSGGTGATNVSRRAGKAAGILTLVFDALKGVAAVLIARLLLTHQEHALWWIGFAGLVAIIGHIFPVWLGFRGGKGVATGNKTGRRYS
jgi:glycerol-3-phosphate acyltransferase PlsY